MSFSFEPGDGLVVVGAELERWHALTTRSVG